MNRPEVSPSPRKRARFAGPDRAGRIDDEALGGTPLHYAISEAQFAF